MYYPEDRAHVSLELLLLECSIGYLGVEMTEVEVHMATYSFFARRCRLLTAEAAEQKYDGGEGGKHTNVKNGGELKPP